MDNKTENFNLSNNPDHADSVSNTFAPKSSSTIELPKGGGAVKGISEKFSANPVTGTSSFSIPLPVSPARGFEPQLALSYDSGSGNSAFGLGWNVGIPSIARKTEEGLPQYLEAEDSDTYILGGLEDLVPFLESSENNWKIKTNTVSLLGIDWEVKLYRPRTEGSYSKIERWRDMANNIIWWRTVSSDNITTVYGLTEQSRLFESEQPEKIFKWFIDFSYDDKGHVIRYVYAQENGSNVNYTASYEAHRKKQPQNQRYLKKVLYGIKESRLKQGITDEDLYSHDFNERDFLFQTVFDYGDHIGDTLETSVDKWPVRHDAFSSYRAGFEVRTYRRCQRVLLFHDFAELGDQPELIRALSFNYDDNTEGFSFIKAITSMGYKRDKNGLLQSKSMPPLRFEYQQHQWKEQLETINPESIENLPMGVDGQQYQWVDLYGEGLSGVLTEQAGGLYYKQNVGTANLAAAKLVSSSPSLKGFANTWQFQDLDSNGIKSLVSTSGEIKGYYKFDSLEEWQNFIPFPNMPTINFNDPNLRIIDLNGDGKPDVLITEERVFRWYPSLGKGGYKESRIAASPVDDTGGAEIIFSNQSESIFTADMTGDGLNDIVRIRNGNVVYWPNLGYGKFGDKIIMANSPYFNHPDLFTAAHIRLADLDGSGTTDIIYLGKNEFKFWLNHSGNSWNTSNSILNPFPDVDNSSNISIIDLLGSGTACIVWSSPLPAYKGQPIRYVDLMASTKPYLMKTYHNGFGKTVNLEYTPSTQFYLDDKAKGEPWVTKLHFPVHCLSKTESIDHITGARFTSTYSYHHGYYDHAEREFRGFGRVDQTNTEDFDHFIKAGSTNVQEKVLHQTPVLVKTWFHNGAYLDQERILNQYEQEYCSYQNQEYDHLVGFDLEQPELPEDLTAAEWREALRACKGMALRTETYGLDGTDKEPYPFSIAYSTCRITKVQDKADNAYAVFQVQNTESVTITLDRNPEDPRISHNLLLKADAYGQSMLSAVINYGRRIEGSAAIDAEQKITQCVISELEYTVDEYGLLGGHDFDIFEETLRPPVAFKNTTFELGLAWSWDGINGTNGKRFELAKLNALFEATEDNSVDYLRIEQSVGKDKDVAKAYAGERRLLSCAETRFANENLDGELGRGQLNQRGISWSSYQLAYTPALIEHIYGDKVDPATLEGGYVHLEGDSNWWIPSGHAIYHHPDYQEGFEVRFFIPYGARDALGAASWTQLDDYLLLPKAESVSRVGYDDQNAGTNSDAWYLKLNQSIAINDYRTLSPKFMRDANENWSAVEADALGMVVKSAVMGKVEIVDENTPPTPDAISQGDNLETPSAIMEYGFYDETTGQPAWAYSKTYTAHFATNGETRFAIDQENNSLKFLQQWEYSDGSGNVTMVKMQTTPGIAKRIDIDGIVTEIDTGENIRWIGNGRTIINNAGNPVKQYEPYFSVTHEYESAAELVETGISPILFYDAAGRNVCKLNPNKTYEKVVFDAWQQQNWDVNDNLFLPQTDGSKITDYQADPDVGHFFSGLEVGEYSPSWYERRINGDLGIQEQQAAQKTELHVATPGESHSDALGRTIYALAHNRLEDGTDEKYETLTHLDIESNMLSVVDDRGNAVMGYRYNMLPPPDKENPKPALYQNSMDGGEKWSLFDIQGKPIKNWDSRGHVFENTYDSLHRPTESKVLEDGTVKLVGLTEYVDSDHPDASQLKQSNLMGAVTTAYDQSGRSQTLAMDFKGNLLQVTKTLASDYKNTIDWRADPDLKLENEVFQSTSQYDALNRVIFTESPNTEAIPASITKPTYNEAGALDQMIVSIRGGDEKVYVENIDYDAKGQRQLINYGNGVQTNYKYELDTYRLKHLLTTDSNGKQLQDLHYSYDPAGNITEILDNAQSTAYYDNSVVKPERNYVYDPLYRLIEATGREHATQANTPHSGNGWEALQTSDDLALQEYIQTYEYDGVGNILLMAHRRPNNNNTGWTRNYDYAQSNNRLLVTTLGNPELPFDEQYAYNVHGSITSMPHLPVMDWGFSEQLRHVDLQGGGDAYYVYDASGQRTRKVIETNGSTVKDRIYMGGWEIYRERNVGGLQLERESLHIMDDQQRIAMVETKTVGSPSAEGFDPITRYQLANHLESVNLELDDNGGIISYEEFHPYGTTAYHAGTSLVQISRKRYRYTGKERDEETGFSYHEARYFLPLFGRWSSTDPIGIGDGVNLYAYAKLNPIMAYDPSGTVTLSELPEQVRPIDNKGSELDIGGGFTVKLEGDVFMMKASGAYGFDWKPASEESIETLKGHADFQKTMSLAAGIVAAPLVLLVAIEVGGAAGAKFLAEEVGGAIFEAVTGLPLLNPKDILEIPGAVSKSLRKIDFRAVRETFLNSQNRFEDWARTMETNIIDKRLSDAIGSSTPDVRLPERSPFPVRGSRKNRGAIYAETADGVVIDKIITSKGKKVTGHNEQLGITELIEVTREGSQELVSEIWIYTERATCVSCAEAVLKLEELFPNAAVRVKDSYGRLSWPEVGN